MNNIRNAKSHSGTTGDASCKMSTSYHHLCSITLLCCLPLTYKHSRLCQFKERTVVKFSSNTEVSQVQITLAYSLFSLERQPSGFP